MPTVARADGISFVIYSNDHNPPHVHVKLSDGSECRINLVSGEFMDAAPAGMMKKIRKTYSENVEAIWVAWEEYHPDYP